MVVGPHSGEIIVTESRLRSLCSCALERAGMPASEAQLLTDSFVDASLRGVDSHGVNLLPEYLHRIRTRGWTVPNRACIVSERGAVALADGTAGVGQVTAAWAMEHAMRLAGMFGVGAVVVRNSSHFGAAGYFARHALARGMVGIVFTNTSPAMAPAGGLDALVGNNPLAVALPSEEKFAVVLDMAMSVVARSRIRVAAQRGEAIPDGWALDPEGEPTTDPQLALLGTLLPMGGHKGYGLAIAIDVLCGILSGGCFGGDVQPPFRIALNDSDANTSERDGLAPQGACHLMVALDVTACRPLDAFRRDVSTMIKRLRVSRRRPGVDQIRIPGEIEYELARSRSRLGIPIREEVLQLLTTG